MLPNRKCLDLWSFSCDLERKLPLLSRYLVLPRFRLFGLVVAFRCTQQQLQGEYGQKVVAGAIRSSTQPASCSTTNYDAPLRPGESYAAHVAPLITMTMFACFSLLSVTFYFILFYFFFIIFIIPTAASSGADAGPQLTNDQYKCL